MSKKLKLVFILFICISSSLIANAQKIFKEGKAVYSVKYNLPPEQEFMSGMLPSEYQIFFKDGVSKFKMDMGMFATQIIYNSSTNETLTLTDIPMQNKKVAMKMSSEQNKAMNKSQNGFADYEVTPTTETKKIAGYNCVKYLLKEKDSGNKGEVWTTTEINIPANTFTSNMKNIKGVPIEFSTVAQGMSLKMTLKSISDETVAPISMAIPSGYETITLEEAMKQMGH